MLTFDLVQTDKHSTIDLLQPKNLQFLYQANHINSLVNMADSNYPTSKR